MYILMLILATCSIICIILSVIRIFKGKYNEIYSQFKNIKTNYDNLILQEKNLNSTKNKLEKESNEIFSIYEITKQVSTALDEEKAFTTFKDKIRDNISFTDCKLFLQHYELEENKDYLKFSLIAEKSIGYLAIKGLAESDLDTFKILAHQFALCLRRVLLYKKIEELAITDTLTGTYTRRYCLERFTEELIRSGNNKFNLSFLMIDLDNFKVFNDTYGHLVGDAILKEIAKLIKANIREIDLLGRFGGEEFSVILVETPKDGANFAAERIRKAIAEYEFKVYDENVKLTLSIGLSTFPDDAATSTELIDKADWALYRAKKMGRNRTCTFGIYK